MMMVRKSKGLSERHIKILDLLQKYAEKEGYPPSIREIGEQTGRPEFTNLHDIMEEEN